MLFSGTVSTNTEYIKINSSQMFGGVLKLKLGDKINVNLIGFHNVDSTSTFRIGYYFVSNGINCASSSISTFKNDTFYINDSFNPF